MPGGGDVLAGRANSAARRRRRPRHAVANDLRLRLAAVTVINESGWDDFSLNKVSQATGLAKGALYTRYASKSALGIHAWQQDLFPELTTALELAFHAATPPLAQDPAPFSATMASFARPTPQVSAAVELLMASIVHPELATEVTEATRDWMHRHCPPNAAGADSRSALQATQAVAILTWALGLVIFADRPWVEEMDIGPALTRAHHALTHPASPRPLPEGTAEYLRTSPFHTDDPRIDKALDHASESIGSIGYQRTRMQDVARVAGVSEAFLLLRFKTKIDMFRMITDQGYAAGYQAFTDFQLSVAADHGHGMAEAVAWREYLNPAIRDRQTIGIETDRLARHNPTMRRTILPTEELILAERLDGARDSDRPTLIGDTHLDFAVGHGLPLVGLLLPHAWSLPLNTVTEPYMSGHPYAAPGTR